MCPTACHQRGRCDWCIYLPRRVNRSSHCQPTDPRHRHAGKRTYIAAATQNNRNLSAETRLLFSIKRQRDVRIDMLALLFYTYSHDVMEVTWCPTVTQHITFEGDLALHFSLTSILAVAAVIKIRQTWIWQPNTRHTCISAAATIATAQCRQQMSTSPLMCKQKDYVLTLLAAVTSRAGLLSQSIKRCRLNKRGIPHMKRSFEVK